ncbi:MAG: efflux RND transporter periplasmic adaptor subunit [Moheibacter sp.]
MKAKFIVFSVFPALVLFSCGKKTEPMAAPPPTVPVIEVTARDVTGYYSFPVNIEGKVNNAVRAKISGYIRNVYVDEGQIVRKGQPLFRLETNVQSQDAHAAQAGINAAQANINAAQASVNAAQVEVDKLIPLVEKNIISNVQLETAKANLSRAQGQLAQARAAYQQAKASYSGIQANIDFGVVKSPISGVVGSIQFREGSLVGPNDPTPITTVSEVGEVYAYFSMNEAEYLDFLSATEGKTVQEKLKQMPEVELILANGQAYSEKGKIQTVTGQINPQTGTIQFRAIFKNTDRLLNNGNSGTLRIPKPYTDVLAVPENATFEQQGIVYVYSVKNDTVYSTPIVVEDRINNIAVVKSGLQKGDIVVVKGIGKLRNQSPVQEQKVDFDSIVASVKPVM